jgi:cyclopropane-fatty-acyl-phospholipid synthase
MSLVASAIRAIERAPLPDPVSRRGIEFLVARTQRRLAGLSAPTDLAFAQTMTQRAVAEHAEAANDQHYALPPAFFALMLGPHRKYSCCYYREAQTSLAEAERAALEETVAHADLADGQRILELGCGWGSLTLFMAERFPAARITAVSNAAPQRLFIEAQAKARGLSNVTVLTADMNAFTASGRYDRVVSVEMFEHIANWRALLARIRDWLTTDGRLFLHVFSHRSQPYAFDHTDATDWIAQHFFTGGIMPSHALAGQFPDLFAIEDEWRWSGTHYARTARDWLANFDANRAKVDQVLTQVYGADANLWRRRWRLFLLATEGLFGYDGGAAWGVSHYRLRPVTVS